MILACTVLGLPFWDSFMNALNSGVGSFGWQSAKFCLKACRDFCVSTTKLGQPYRFDHPTWVLEYLVPTIVWDSYVWCYLFRDGTLVWCSAILSYYSYMLVCSLHLMWRKLYIVCAPVTSVMENIALRGCQWVRLSYSIDFHHNLNEMSIPKMQLFSTSFLL